MEYARICHSPMGTLTLTASEEGLTGLYLREPTLEEKTLPDDPSVFSDAENWLDRYFRGEQPSPEVLSLAPRGSEFQLLIWKLLLQIPYGQTRTYGDLAGQAAALLGKGKMSAQAVGGAVGHNPISIIIPCHRVVAAGNRLGGFGWGLDAKKALLRHENILTIYR